MIANMLRRVIPPSLRPIGYLTQLAQRRTNSSVIKGPFAGMKYVEVSQGSAYIPKLLGIYERELTHVIDELCRHDPQIVIDIGAAEGYYAVGMALKCPRASVIAFELEKRGQEALLKMGKLNNVSDRIFVKGECNPTNLASALHDSPENCAVICDVEGTEETLLDPSAVPGLKKAFIIVELHDFLVPNITQTLISRFAETHRITHIWQEPRKRDEFPWRTLGTFFLPRRYLDWAVSEWRPVKMSWLSLTPK